MKGPCHVAKVMARDKDNDRDIQVPAKLSMLSAHSFFELRGASTHIPLGLIGPLLSILVAVVGLAGSSMTTINIQAVTTKHRRRHCTKASTSCLWVPRDDGNAVYVSQMMATKGIEMCHAVCHHMNSASLLLCSSQAEREMKRRPTRPRAAMERCTPVLGQQNSAM
mmetsp:Transcript_5816/g.17186  ORF Transcript_5816/g.17186 Transcript_5816/m.17186 type:complete len:166 (+) Transcript_5816:18-515(+)